MMLSDLLSFHIFNCKLASVKKKLEKKKKAMLASNNQVNSNLIVKILGTNYDT